MCALFAPPSTLSKATAAGGYTYACIGEDCYFYDTPTLTRGVFLLPETYFVKILEEQDAYYRIEYLTDTAFTRKIVGYCRKEKVSPVDFQPTNPYLYRSFDVKYQTGGETGDGFLTQITLSCAYYGDYRIGEQDYCYVLRGEEFGYVPKPDGFFYERNPEAAQTPSSPAKDDSASSPPYLLFLILALLAPAVAFLLFKSSSKKPFDPPEER